uniref:CBM20 domain-containing protein n=1 Tax=Chromera velia CCMP2878 TaxID=1169474 RepID=A0A0G4FZ72_9ALVE|eukprot:Cvel_19503.t1-p1 / transcript=Cvel_19503.t1 / gene=Cvel_19503 / organism=Chromera_velia_CCMP2878 / gene_product=Zinc finger protein 283, putative / transcript_product=Zinc finger protein 283, putative / location=Cvel_scaffold1687:12517-14280(+) / protein_length=544 / sequence_SO=supercontig / SO=protein_coding / is_pseudo=false
MKGLVAFVAHCPEVRENQRVVVVGECPELGGWELGGALSLRPAPCGRPWWVSSEGDVADLPDSHEVVCLEGLKGGHFRVVRLVVGLAAAERSSVGERYERGENTICVGEGVGGEGEETEFVGISVEWGVPESVQLALLPLYTNRQAEHLQRQSEHPGLSDHPTQSENASPMSSGMTQAAPRMFDSESQDTSSVSLCRHKTAVHSRQSDSERRKGEGENRSLSVGVGSCPSDGECESDNPIPSSHPSTSTHLQTRDRTRDRQPEERLCERPHGFAVSLKRRRSEAALTQLRGDECDEVSGLDGERSGGASGELEREGGCVREEKRRCLSASLPSSAPLSSESCGGRGDPVAEGRADVSAENGRRGGEGGDMKRDRHGKILCLHGRVRYSCKECVGGGICAHGRQRSQCKDCGGKGICAHGRLRSQCRECGGKKICEHGRQRPDCKECGGASICEHGRKRYFCKDCGGKGICAHGRIRSQCRECGGTKICEHGRRRTDCKECGGGSICEHGRKRYFCKDCGGRGICVHKKRRYDCKECKQVSSLPL